jgi:hypothetical protein
MRKSVSVDGRLLRAAQVRASARGITLSAFVEEVLARAVAIPAKPSRPFRLRWRTHRGKALPGLDFARRDSLYEAREGGA